MSKKTIVYAGIGFFMFTGIAAIRPNQEDPKWKNLKVIPKNTGDDQMERIMYKYDKQLGVTCVYCHPFTKPDVFPKRVDFATDEKREKVVARNMMLMTDKINKKYFNYRNNYTLESLNKPIGISCITCHRGFPKPNNMKLFNIE